MAMYMSPDHSKPTTQQGSWGSKRRTNSSLTFSRRRLLQTSMETLEIAHHGSYTNSNGGSIDIQESLDKAMKDTVHYHHEHSFSTSRRAGRKVFDNTEFRVVYSASLEAASKLTDYEHIGVLNSASGKTPGGGFFKGTVSQEDCICRASLLYPCIAQFQLKRNHFYQINSGDEYKFSSSRCALFSPRVPVIREDNVQGNLLNNYYECSFVSIPAANAFTAEKGANDCDCATPPATQPVATKPPTEACIDFESKRRVLENAMTDRIFRALSIFAEQECTDLVLCAFGCGVHGNDPSMVAEIFKEMITEDFKGCFKRVVFAIPRSRPHNYTAFSAVFQTNQ